MAPPNTLSAMSQWISVLARVVAYVIHRYTIPSCSVVLSMNASCLLKRQDDRQALHPGWPAGPVSICTHTHVTSILPSNICCPWHKLCIAQKAMNP
eukprot:scaffold197959_cov31-Tisochrysis_lutea.AAC.2